MSIACASLRFGTVLVALALTAAACMPDGERPSETPIATTALASTPPSPASSPDQGTVSPPPVAVLPATPAPPASVTPAPSPVAAASLERFALNLATRADFVAQHTFEWCVGASLQMALNMVTDDERSSKADQRRLWEMARDRSFSPFGGANPRGWTAALNDLEVGPYVLVSLPTFEAALDAAAEAIRATERPVGLVMWRGRHAWVMSGFESRGDPLEVDGARITGIRVHDPLYPHGSLVWGKSPKPNSLITPATLAEQFVRRDSRRVNLGVPPGYLLILPVAEA